MATFDVTNTYIYRWRYYLGYGLIALALIVALVFAGLYIPGGISTQEMNSVVQSNTASVFNTSAANVVHLPYYLLQRLSITILGVHDFSIKLPSLTLAFFAAIGLVLLLRRWFAQNIAILASLIAVTTGQFMFIAQSGTPSILYLFWPVWLLYFATLIANREKPDLLYKVAFFIFAALSLYTPLSIYPLIALGVAMVIHPHLRFIIRQLSRKKLLLGILTGILILIPLIKDIFITPTLLLTLLGIPTTLPNIGANLMQLLQQFFGFTSTSGTTLMTPVFGLGSTLLIAIGLYSTIKTRETAKSYIIFLWTLLLLPAIILKPAFTTVTFLPLVLFLTTGILTVLNYWYRLFPRNPYARIGGLIPIVILVVALVASGLDRYVYGYHYDPAIASNFSNDLRLLPKDTKEIVVSPAELPFYTVVGDHTKGLLIVSSTSVGSRFASTQAAMQITGLQYYLSQRYLLTRIITSSASSNSDRFYVYNN
jgi:hypothetical protein